jgi:protein dithiol oxidoreductase (disulfide-forming)
MLPLELSSAHRIKIPMMKKILAGIIGLTAIGFLGFSWLSNAEEPVAPQAAAAEAPAATAQPPAQAPSKIIVLEEGRNYRVVAPAQPTEATDKVEVMEIFWYGCPHCHHFEPFLSKWLETKPNDVAFRRFPAIFRENWVPAARAFYTAQALGIGDKLHPALFKAMHEEQRELRSNEDWAKLFGELGVAEADFLKTWDSLEVATKVREAMAQVQNYGIEGVPAVVIGGKYQTSAGMEGVGDYETLLKVVNALVDKVRTEAKPAG